MNNIDNKNNPNFKPQPPNNNQGQATSFQSIWQDAKSFFSPAPKIQGLVERDQPFSSQQQPSVVLQGQSVTTQVISAEELNAKLSEAIKKAIKKGNSKEINSLLNEAFTYNIPISIEIFILATKQKMFNKFKDTALRILRMVGGINTLLNENIIKNKAYTNEINIECKGKTLLYLIYYFIDKGYEAFKLVLRDYKYEANLAEIQELLIKACAEGRVHFLKAVCEKFHQEIDTNSSLKEELIRACLIDSKRGACCDELLSQFSFDGSLIENIISSKHKESRNTLLLARLKSALNTKNEKWANIFFKIGEKLGCKFSLDACLMAINNHSSVASELVEFYKDETSDVKKRLEYFDSDLLLTALNKKNYEIAAQLFPYFCEKYLDRALSALEVANTEYCGGFKPHIPFFETLTKKYPTGIPCDTNTKTAILYTLKSRKGTDEQIRIIDSLLKTETQPFHSPVNVIPEKLVIPEDLYTWLPKGRMHYDALNYIPFEVCYMALEKSKWKPHFTQFVKQWVSKYFENLPIEDKQLPRSWSLFYNQYALSNHFGILVFSASHSFPYGINNELVEFLLSEKFLQNEDFRKDLFMIIKNHCRYQQEISFIEIILRSPACKNLILPILEELIELSQNECCPKPYKINEMLKAYKANLEANQEAATYPSEQDLDLALDNNSFFNDIGDIFNSTEQLEAPPEMIQELENVFQTPDINPQNNSQLVEDHIQARANQWNIAINDPQYKIVSNLVFQKINDYFRKNANRFINQLELEGGSFKFNFSTSKLDDLFADLLNLIQKSPKPNLEFVAIVSWLENFGFYGNISECMGKISSLKEINIWLHFTTVWKDRNELKQSTISNAASSGDAPTLFKLKLAELKKQAAEIVNFHKNGECLFPHLSEQIIPVVLLEEKENEEFVLHPHQAYFNKKGMLESLCYSQEDFIPQFLDLLDCSSNDLMIENELTISKNQCDLLLNKAKDKLANSEVPPFLVFFKAEKPSVPSNQTHSSEKEVGNDSTTAPKRNGKRLKRKTPDDSEAPSSSRVLQNKKSKTTTATQSTDLISIFDEEEIDGLGEFWSSLSVKTIAQKIKAQSNKKVKNRIKDNEWEANVAPLAYPAGMLQKADPSLSLQPLFLDSQLMQYQRDNIQAILAALLSNLKGFLLADEMGLGKTKQSAELLLQALHLKEKPALFLSTASTLKQTKDSFLQAIIDTSYYFFQKKIENCKNDIEASFVYSQIKSYLLFFDKQVQETQQTAKRDRTKIQKKAKHIEKLKRPFIELLTELERGFQVRSFEDVDLDLPFNESPFEIIYTCTRSDKLSRKLNELSTGPKKKILLTTHDLIVESKGGNLLHAEALKKSRLSFIGIDEAQNFDEEKSNRFKNLLKILDQLEPEYYPFVVPTTGTPYENKIDNIFAILRMMGSVTPGEKKEFDDTRKTINLLLKNAANEVTKYADGKRQDHQKAYQALKKAFVHLETLRNVLRSRMQRHVKKSDAVKRDWGKTKMTKKIVPPAIKLQLIGDQKTRSDEVHTEFKGEQTFGDAAERNHTGYLAFNQKSQQVLVHSELGYGQDSDNKVAEKVTKLKQEDLKVWIKKSAMLDQIVNVYGPVIFHECAPTLIFVESLAAGSIIKTCLEKIYQIKNIPFISGSTHHSQRKKIVKEFNKPNGDVKQPKVVILMRKAAGAGLDFKAATLEIFAQTPFNTFALKQAECRGDRVNCITETGERKKLYVVYFDCETEGEKYLQRIRKHKELWGNYFVDSQISTENNCKANFLEVSEAICRSLHHSYCVGDKLQEVDRLLAMLREEAEEDDTLWECVQRSQPEFHQEDLESINESDNMEIANDIESSLTDANENLEIADDIESFLTEANQKARVLVDPFPLAKKAVVSIKPASQDSMEISECAFQILNVTNIGGTTYYKLPSMSLRDAVCIASSITRGNNSFDKKKHLYTCVKSSDDKALDQLLFKMVQPWKDTTDEGALNYCQERSIQLQAYEPSNLTVKKLNNFASPSQTICLLKGEASKKYHLLLPRT